MKLFRTHRVRLALAGIVCLLAAAIVFAGPLPVVVADWTQAKKMIPPVLLTDQHKALCEVGAGDQMPTAKLEILGGKKAKMADQFGKEATVVYLFDPDQRMSRTGLADMETDVVGEFGEQGVKVVGVAVESSAGAVRKLVKDSKASFPVMLDPKGTLFRAVGTEKLPRVYLLDSEGKILWYDIEYSQTTRRELRQALGFRIL